MSEWKEERLDYFFTLRRGFDLPSQNRLKGKVPIISSSGITGYHNESAVKGPGVITGRYGTIGEVFYTEDEYWPLNTTLYVSNFNNVYPKFVYYFLKCFDFDKFNDKSTVPGINRNHIHQESVKIPNIDLQKSITEVLSSLDDKIDLLHRNNKTLEQLAETLFRQWFVEEADESIVGEEFNVTMGQSPPGDSYNEDGNGVLFYQGRTDFSFRIPTPRLYTTEPKRYASRLDTLLSVRAPVGDINIATEKCCIGRGLAAIRHRNMNLHYSYTYNCFKHLRETLDIHEDSGTIFGSINKDDLLAMKCIKFNEDNLEKYNIHIGILDDKILSNCNQINQLESLRDTLLPKLMSGVVSIIN